MTWPPARLLIDGTLRESTDRARFDLVNPATEEIIDTAPDATVTDLDEAIGAARRAFDDTGWSTDAALRVHCLKQLHTALVDNGAAMRALTLLIGMLAAA